MDQPDSRHYPGVDRDWFMLVLYDFAFFRCACCMACSWWVAWLTLTRYYKMEKIKLQLSVRFSINGVPCSLPALGTDLQPPCAPPGFPADAPVFPDRALEATGATNHPAERLRSHIFCPRFREHGSQEVLDECHVCFPLAKQGLS